MPRLSPAAGYCLSAGIGLWCARASLDVAGSADRPTRIAMLPSWPDFLGLTILVGLVVVLAQAALARWHRPERNDRARADLLAPLTGLLVLAVPYLPWLPDAVPVLRVLAGPARFAVMAVVAGQMVWLAWDARHSPAPVRPGGRARAWIVFACGLAVYGGAAHRLSGTPLYPGGDEPHYLVIAQSLLRDGDLEIGNNHARGDYREYFGGDLEPHVNATGRHGEIYSVHPIGLPLLIAPVYAAAGYRGVLVFLVVLSSAAAALMWRRAAQLTGSDAAATVAWLAVGGSASYVLHSFAVYPEIPAALAVVLAVAPLAGARPRTPAGVVAQGIVIALLPWLSTKYALVALVLLAAAAYELRRSPAAVARVMVPCAIAWVGWLYFFYALWGSPSPSAPYGPEHHMSLTTLLVGAPGLFLDQEYGVLPYAPALLFALPGLWRLWADGGDRRRLAIVIVAALGALVCTVGAFHIWWGGSAPPGREVVSGLLLLGFPIARWAAHVEGATMRTAIVRTLTLVGLTITAAMIGALDGLLIANGRDGTSRLLEWLESGREIARLAPSFILVPAHARAAIATSLVWAVVAAAAAWTIRRMRPVPAGAAAARSLIVGTGTLTVGAVLIAIAGAGDLQPRRDPVLRVESAMLDRYDARRRPIAIEYAPFTGIDADAVPPLFTFMAAPGARTAPQPMRVLLNMRLSLPPGTYDATIEPRPGAALRGTVGLQVGRRGPALREWTIDLPAGTGWRQRFDLPVDASFVGLRTPVELERAVSKVTVAPVSIVNLSDRPDLPVVLSAVQYGRVTVTFHDETVYPEQAGFWVRGRSTLLATFALPPDRGADPGIRLTLHGGAAAGAVRFETPTWRTRVTLEPGRRSEVTIPALPAQRLLPVRIVTETGFVPAEQGSNADRRLLGCWIEVLE